MTNLMPSVIMLEAYPNLKWLAEKFNSMDGQDIGLHEEIMLQTNEIIEEFKKDHWPPFPLINSDADLRKLIEQFFANDAQDFDIHQRILHRTKQILGLL